MSQLMSEQLAALLRVRSELSFPEYDVVFHGVRESIDRSGG
jgi:hypothetical protein